MIRVLDCGVRRSGRWILENINWSVGEGELAAILGPNGGGKSTLSRLLGGVIWPTAGEVLLRDEQNQWQPPARLRERIRLVQQGGMLDVDTALSARQVVCTGFFATLSLYARPRRKMSRRADELLEQVGLRVEAEQPYATLSTGEKLRALIARAMAVRPRLLILDEPTAGLDLLAREQVLATLHRLMQDRSVPRTSVVLVTHHVEELPALTATVLLLARGKMIAAGPGSSVLRASHLSRAYGVRVQVNRRDGRYHTRVHPHAWKKLVLL